MMLYSFLYLSKIIKINFKKFNFKKYFLFNLKKEILI